MFEELNRRDFIRKAGGCSTLTSISLMSTLLNLRATTSIAAGIGPFPEGDYRALVCVFMFGGNDAFNMLVPTDQSGYRDYERARSNLALRREDLLPISGHDGREFGLHRSMSGMKELYDAGKAAVLANVGSLVRPTTLQDVQNKNNLPLGLYSHSDLVRHWQTSTPEERANLSGWAGRMADVLTDQTNSNPSVSMNYSIGSSPLVLNGAGVLPYVIGNTGATEIREYLSTGRRGKIVTQATDSILAQTYTNLLSQTHATSRRNAIDAAVAFNSATDSVQLSTQFPNTNLGRQLEIVARIIGSRKSLGQQRQVFFVSRGGFDNHNELLNNQSNLLREVSDAINAFYTATADDLGIENQVTTFTASDFGRTLSSNGNGTDHAWGGNHILVGGGVKGGRIYGQYPDSLRNPIGVVDGSETRLEASNGRGRLIPTTSVDEYNAELAMWFGIPSDENLKTILPNIENFMRLGRRAPLGILS